MASTKRLKKGRYVLVPCENQNGAIYPNGKWPAIIDSVVNEQQQVTTSSTSNQRAITYFVRFLPYGNQVLEAFVDPLPFSSDKMYVKL